MHCPAASFIESGRWRGFNDLSWHYSGVDARQALPFVIGRVKEQADGAPASSSSSSSAIGSAIGSAISFDHAVCRMPHATNAAGSDFFGKQRCRMLCRR